VDELLDALYWRGFITRYVVDGHRFIEVVNFPKHQHCHAKEPESTIPAPDDTGADQVQKRLVTVISNPKSLISNPITQTPDTSGFDWVGAFEDFWSIYPRKEAKKRSQDYWRALKPNQELVEKIMADVQRRKGSKQWQKGDGEFIPMAASYLNQRRWNDETSIDNRPPNPRPDDYVWDDQYSEWRMPDKVGWGG
jgi:hypothetical protein